MREQLFDELGGNVGIVFQTSGSTGKPKRILADLTKMLDHYINNPSRPTKMLCFLNLAHIGGINTVIRAITSGSQLFFPRSRQLDDVLDCVYCNGVEVLPVNPSFLTLLKISWDDGFADLLKTVRLITYGSEPMPQETLDFLVRKLPFIKFKQTYGLTETGIMDIESDSDDSLWFKLRDEHLIVANQLWLKTKDWIVGDLDNENTMVGRFYNTEDRVIEREDGALRIMGRESEIIMVGGEKVYPAEVENLIMKSPSVRDCVVFGEKNKILGNIVCAKILLFDGVSSDMFLKDQTWGSCIPRYARPIRISIVNEIEYFESGKKRRKFTCQVPKNEQSPS